MGRIAVVTHPTAGLTPGMAMAGGGKVVPLYVRFGADGFHAGVDLSVEQFWTRVLGWGNDGRCRRALSAPLIAGHERGW